MTDDVDAIPLGKPWGDEAENEEVRAYAEQLHQSMRAVIEQGVSMSVRHFAHLNVPQSVVARTVIISLIEAAADEVAHYLAGFSATDAQVQAAAEAEAGFLLVSIPKAVPAWREKVAAAKARRN